MAGVTLDGAFQQFEGLRRLILCDQHERTHNERVLEIRFGSDIERFFDVIPVPLSCRSLQVTLKQQPGDLNTDS